MREEIRKKESGEKGAKCENCSKQNIILSKVCQAQKTKNCMFSLLCRL
jgi:hypothetical protein